MQQAGTAAFRLEDMDFGRRMALERELDQNSGPGGALRTANAVWDESGNFILYATMLGIKGRFILDCIVQESARTMTDDILGSYKHGDKQSSKGARKG